MTPHAQHAKAIAPSTLQRSAQHVTAIARSTLQRSAEHATAKRPAPRSDSAEQVQRQRQRQAVANDATCTRASLKHAPPPRSVSVSGTRAVPVVLFRTL